MDTTTKQTKLAELWRDGWSLSTIARQLGTSPLAVLALLRRLREDAGAKTNEELRTILKGWGK